jgi:hypothetical protein
MLDKMTIDDFADRVGETFSGAAADGRALALTLASVDALPAASDGGRAPFSLEFVDATPDHVPQQIVALEHPEVGAFELFVVPLGPDARGMRYQAIFT